MFSFASCSRKGVMRFLRWLGVEISDGTSARILSASNVVDESVDVCVETFEHILSVARRKRFNVPIGVLCESVSRYKNDADAAKQLSVVLGKQLEEHCRLEQERLEAEAAAAKPLIMTSQ